MKQDFNTWTLEPLQVYSRTTAKMNYDFVGVLKERKEGLGLWR